MSTTGIKDLVSGAMASMKQMMEVDNVIGAPITAPDGSIIIPVTKISCGFGAGGFEQQPKDVATAVTDYPFGGGSGGGMKVEPCAFLILSDGNVRMVPVQEVQSGAEKIMDMVPGMIDKLNGIIKGYTDKAKAKKETEEIIVEEIIKEVE